MEREHIQSPFILFSPLSFCVLSFSTLMGKLEIGQGQKIGKKIGSLTDGAFTLSFVLALLLESSKMLYSGGICLY